MDSQIQELRFRIASREYESKMPEENGSSEDEEELSEQFAKGCFKDAEKKAMEMVSYKLLLKAGKNDDALKFKLRVIAEYLQDIIADLYYDNKTKADN